MLLARQQEVLELLRVRLRHEGLHPRQNLLLLLAPRAAAAAATAAAAAAAATTAATPRQEPQRLHKGVIAHVLLACQQEVLELLRVRLRPEGRLLLAPRAPTAATAAAPRQEPRRLHEGVIAHALLLARQKEVLELLRVRLRHEGRLLRLRESAASPGLGLQAVVRRQRLDGRGELVGLAGGQAEVRLERGAVVLEQQAWIQRFSEASQLVRLAREHGVHRALWVPEPTHHHVDAPFFGWPGSAAPAAAAAPAPRQESRSLHHTALDAPHFL